jgi:hypothetical protein
MNGTNDAAAAAQKPTPAPFARGHRPELADPERHEHESVVLEVLRSLTDRLGLALDSAELETLKRTSLAFFEELYETRYAGASWERLAVTREAFRALLPMLEAPIDAAYGRSDRKEAERIAERTAAEMASPRRVVGRWSPERQRYDPDCWDLSESGGDAAYLRLSQLCEVVQVQNERAIEEARAGRTPLPDGRLRPEEAAELRNILARALEGDVHAWPARRPRRGWWSRVIGWRERTSR